MANAILMASGLEVFLSLSNFLEALAGAGCTVSGVLVEALLHPLTFELHPLGTVCVQMMPTLASARCVLVGPADGSVSGLCVCHVSLIGQRRAGLRLFETNQRERRPNIRHPLAPVPALGV